MNTPEHHAIVSLALDSLPPESACVWAPLGAALLEACMLPDRVAIPLLEGRRGPWRRYFPRRTPKFNFQQVRRGPRAFLPDAGFYTRSVLSHLRRGQGEEAARFAGVLSHYVGDYTQPAHYYELDIGMLLLPPAHMRNCEYHRMIEDIPSSVPPLRTRPSLLGTSPGEMIFRLEGRFAALHARSVAAVIPMVRAIYRRRNDLAARVLNPIVRDSARIFADFLHTAAAVATRRFPSPELRRLETCDLRQVEPNDYDVEFNFGHRPLVDAVTVEEYGRARPLALWRKNGRRVAPEVVKGICVVPHALPLKGVEMGAMLEYRLPPGVYRRFQADVGLLAGVDRQARCTFTVLADGKAVYRGPMVGPRDLAATVSVGVSRCRRLRLHVRTDGSTDKLAFPVWAHPRLTK